MRDFKKRYPKFDNPSSRFEIVIVDDSQPEPAHDKSNDENQDPITFSTTDIVDVDEPVEKVGIAVPTDSYKGQSHESYQYPDDVKGLRRALSTPPTPQIEPVLTSEEMVMDYVTLRGLENKLGLSKQNVPEYILHELLDNSLDYIETTLSRGLSPEINVYVSINDKALHLKVSNPDTNQTFTTEIIKDMFNYYNYSSTKRNQFKISRGALGHGLKTVLGATYALATEHYNHSSWTPIKIRNRNKEFTVTLTVDKITGLHPPDIKSTIIKDTQNTEIEINIPIDRDSVTKNLKSLKSCFYKYLILNPHITMNITINGIHHNYPQVQRIKTDWRNLHSIWNYSEKDFEYLISTTRGNITLFDAIISIRLSEAYALKKRPEFSIPLNEAQYDKSLIRTLYHDLKIQHPKDRLEMPYDMRLNLGKMP